MYARRGGGTGPSKATPNTLCQKCLKKGHYSYECKEPRTERPYVSRPSRTQQLFNPKLVPKLMSDESNDLLRKKGIADEQLAKLEQDRARNRENNLETSEANYHDVNSKRKRSMSSASSASTGSVSSYSTNRSRSRSIPQNRPRPPKDSYKNSAKSSRMGAAQKRRRASSSSDEGDGGYGNSSDAERFTRRKFSDASPEARGRRRFSDSSPDARGRRRSPRSRERATRKYSRSPVRSGGERIRFDEEREHPQTSHAHPTQQRFSSPAAKIAPDTSHAHPVQQNFSSPSARTARDERGRRLSNDDERYGTTYRAGDDHRRSASPKQRVPQPSRERSLSPFSKRLALTRAMNGGK